MRSEEKQYKAVLTLKHKERVEQRQEKLECRIHTDLSQAIIQVWGTRVPNEEG